MKNLILFTPFKNKGIRTLSKYRSLVFALFFMANSSFAAMTPLSACLSFIEIILLPHLTIKKVVEVSSYKKKINELNNKNELGLYFDNHKNIIDFTKRARLGLLVNLDYKIVVEYYKKSNGLSLFNYLSYEDLYLFNFNRESRILFFKEHFDILRNYDGYIAPLFNDIGRLSYMLMIKNGYSYFNKILRHNEEVLKWIKDVKDNDDLIKYMALINSEIHKTINLEKYTKNKYKKLIPSMKKQVKRLNQYVLDNKKMNLFDYMLKNHSDELRAYDLNSLITFTDVKDFNKKHLNIYISKYLEKIFSGLPYRFNKDIPFDISWYTKEDLEETITNFFNSFDTNDKKISFNYIFNFNKSLGHIPHSELFLLKHLNYGEKLDDVEMDITLKVNVHDIVTVLVDKIIKSDISELGSAFSYFVDKGYLNEIEDFDKFLGLIKNGIKNNEQIYFKNIINLFTLSIINNNNISRSISVDEIFKSFKANFESIFKNINKYKQEIFESLKSDFKSNPSIYSFSEFEKSISEFNELGLIDGQNQTQLINSFLKRNSKSLNPFLHDNKEIGYQELHRILENISNKYTSILNKNEYKHLISITNSNTLFNVLEIFFNNKISYEENKVRYLLSIFGYSYTRDDFKNSDKYLNDLIPLLIDLRQNKDNEKFISSIDFNLISSPDGRSKLLKYFELYRNILFIKESMKGSPGYYIDKEVINLENIDEYIKKASNILFRSINGFFSNHMDINADELQMLSKKWGDLSTIYTLLARYSKNKSWNKELSVMKTIFSQVLEGNFSNYKYFGGKAFSDASKAKKQLSILSDVNIKNWIKNYNALVMSHSKDSELIDTSVIFDSIESNLIPHLNVLTKGSQVSNNIGEIVNKVAEYKGNPVDLMSVLAQELNYTDELVIRNDLLKSYEIILKRSLSENTTDIKRYLSHLKILSKIESLKISKDVQNDVAYILKILGSKKKKSTSALIFGTTIDHPKLLLQAGCLVKAYSCQNYKVGGYIQTLPAHAIDAHTKILLNFALKSSNFDNFEDYRFVKEAITNSENIVSEFLPEQYIIKFVINDREIFARNLKGYSRNIIRLGSSSGRPAVFAERDYKEGLSYSKELLFIKKSILRTITENIDGINLRQGMNVKVEGTRNPLGAYSDAGSGIEKKSFTIKSRK